MPLEIDVSKKPLFLLPFPIENPAKGSLTAFLKKGRDGIEGRVDNYVRQRAPINSNLELSPQGKNVALGRVGKDETRRIEAIFAEASGKAEKKVTEHEQGLQSQGAMAAEERFAQVVRQKQITDLLLARDASGRSKAITAALDADDLETLRAVSSAPRLIRDELIGPERLEQVEAVVLQRNNPAAYAELQQLRLGLKALREVRDAALNYVRTDAGLAESTRERLERVASEKAATA